LDLQQSCLQQPFFLACRLLGLGQLLALLVYSGLLLQF
jgi:hypothetical protein